jgi:hypothetical protein
MNLCKLSILFFLFLMSCSKSATNVGNNAEACYICYTIIIYGAVTTPLINTETEKCGSDAEISQYISANTSEKMVNNMKETTTKRCDLK